MNKALVTGATGFIGSYLVNYLLREHYQVRALVRTGGNLLPAGVDKITGDLTQPATLKNSCDNIDTVFHLGGYAHAFKEGDPAFAEKHNAINFEGTKNLFQEAVRGGVRSFIYFSSVKAVADSPQNIDEQWQQAPLSPYGIAKRNAEKYLLAAGQEHGIHVCILRPALVYGPGCKGNLYAMLRAIDKNYFIPVPAIGNRRSLISLADICQAAVLAARHTNAKGKIYFVTDGVDYSTRQLYIAMREALGKRLPNWHLPLAGFKLLGHLGDLAEKILRRRLPFNSESMGKLFDSAAYNSQLIQQELGFKPDYDLKKCLPEIIAAYRQQ
ncbi:MAG: NAD-dependent epimerase/dehydratase family protein [Pseudomonadota bacterium]